jgi:hypothetical protein
MDNWPSIAVAGGVAITIAVHEFEHPGVVHLHQEQGNGPDQQMGRSAVEFAVTTGPLTPFVPTMDGNERRQFYRNASAWFSLQGETATPLPLRFL